jgi:hypothetical protein
MKNILKIISFIGLGLTLIPSFLVYQGVLSPETNNNFMLIGTIIWFLTAPFWMNQKSEAVSIDQP